MIIPVTVQAKKVVQAVRKSLKQAWRLRLKKIEDWCWKRTHLMIGVGMVMILILAVSLAVSIYLLIRVKKIEAALGGRIQLECTRQSTIEKVKPSIVRVVGGAGDGSGFFFRQHLIATNYHVVADEPSPKIVYSDSQFETGRVLAADPGSDLAIIKVERDIKPLEWNKDGVQEGDEVLATGFPLGIGLEGDLTANITTITGQRTFDTQGRDTFLQVDGGLIEGMSGGPLLTKCGQIVGINNAQLADHAIGLAIQGIRALAIFGSMMTSPGQYSDAIARINFESDKSPRDTVLAYYNYLKVRNFQEAYKLLSTHFVGDVSYDDWRKGFVFSLDTSVLSVKSDPHNHNRVLVHLGSTDLIEGRFVVRTFEGSWLVRKVDGHFKLWESNIKQIGQRG